MLTSAPTPPSTARLEHKLALDLAFALLAAAPTHDGRVLLIASSRALLAETVVRAAPPFDLAAAPEQVRLAGELVGSLVSSAGEVRIRAEDEIGPAAADGYSGALWAGPRAAGLAGRLAALRGALCPAAPLILVTAGQLAGSLAWLRAGGNDAELEWLAPSPAAVLARAGFRPGRSFSLGGNASPVQAGAARLARSLGRLDLADRAEAAFRRSLLPRCSARPGFCLVLAARRVERS